jgi:acyl-CoA synthetase (AMP-forming)/AMP-acid ligase II
MNIVDPILFQSALQPKAAALCAPGTGIGLVSYGRLAQMIHAICGHLARVGLRRGRVAAVSIKDPIFLTAVTLALARLGVVTVSRYDERVLDAIHVDALIADKPPGRAQIDQIILVDLSWIKGSPEPQSIAATGADDLCRIILTSGTTGDPKGVAFTHRMVAERTATNNYVFGSRFPACTRIYCDLPESSAPGFWFLIHTLWRGGTFFFSGETFEATAEAFEEYGVECVVSSPGGLEMLLRKYEQYPALQAGFDTMIVLGDVLSRSMSERVRARISSHIISDYGSTEAQTTATAPVALIQDTPGAVGHVVPNVTVEIVSETDQVLPAGVEGIVRIKSPFVAKGYMGDADATAKAFRDGWFYPGDRGVLDASTLLRISGRHDSLLNLGGDKVNPETVERALATCAGVAECAAFSVPNELGVETLWAAVVADAGADDEKLKAHCRSALSSQATPAGFVRVERLPRNPAGKIDRRALPNLLSRKWY